MAKVKTAAQGKIKIALLVGSNLPADISQPLSAAKLTAGIDISCAVALSGFTAGATASETMSDPAVCEATNSQVRGASNFDVSLPVFWYVDENGKYTAENNPAYEALKTPGATAAIAVRRHKPSGDAWAQGDLYDIFVFETDEPQTADGNGFVKKIIPGLPQRFKQDLVVAAG